MNPIIVNNSMVPVVLSYLNPISWWNLLRGKGIFEIYAITLWPFILCRSEMSEYTENHEKIHIMQYNDAFVIGFLIIYLYDWAHGIIKYRNDYDGYKSPADKAYYRTRAEQEAYMFDQDLDYLFARKKNDWLTQFSV